jgi:hypothetical protein
MNLGDMFAPMPKAPDEVWTRLHELAVAWWRAPGIRDGVRSSELDRVEKRLRVTLPSAIRNAYCFFGRYPEFTRGQINLVKPEELTFRDGVLIFFTDEHAVARWGVRKADLSAADPPVIMHYGEEMHAAAPSSGLEWKLATERFTAFFTESALLQATESARYINWMENGGPVTMPERLRRITTGAAVRALRDATLYGGDDMLVVVDTPPSLFAVAVAAPTEAIYRDAIAMFPGAKWRQHGDSVHQPDYGDVLKDLDHVMKILRSERAKRRS